MRDRPRSPLTCCIYLEMARSELVKELKDDHNILSVTDGAADSQFVLLEEIAELIAVD